MEFINLTDTDAETSLEHNEHKIHARASLATTNATKSVFNLTLEDVFGDDDDDDKHISREFKDYEMHLQQEMKEWKSLLCEAYGDLKKSKQKHPVVDKTILSPEHREYLAKAPCLQSFIRESIEFRENAHILLELNYAEVMEALKNLEDLCESRLFCVKAVKIAENLANYKKPKS